MRRVRSNLPRGASGGFTLIEILIAITILVVGLVGILALFPVGMKSSKNAVEDSTTSILAESVKSAIMAAFRLAPAGAANISYIHDGVPTGTTFPVPVSGNPTWVPKEAMFVTAPDQDDVFIVGRSYHEESGDYDNDLPNLEVGQLEEGDDVDSGEANPYTQYSYKFMLELSDTVPNLYVVVIFIYRSYDEGKAADGMEGDENDPVNVFSTMVAGN